MIRFTFTYLKPVALFLSIVVLFQCCVVYDKKPVSIEEATNINHKIVKRVKIEFIDGYKLIFDSIYYKKNELHGLLTKSNKRIKSEITEDIYPPEYSYSIYVKSKFEIQIDEEKIKQIKLHNKNRTIELNFWIPVIIVGLLALGAYLYIASNAF